MRKSEPRLVPIALRTLMLIDGQALVLHAGDTPHVLSNRGRVNLTDVGLVPQAVTDFLGRVILDADRRVVSGEGRLALADPPEYPGEHFDVVAAHSAGDCRVEIRRTPRSATEPLAASAFEPEPIGTPPPVSLPDSVLFREARPAYEDLQPARDRAHLQCLVDAARDRKARAIYLSPGSRPAVRVSGQIEPIRDQAVLSIEDIEALWQAFVSSGTDGPATSRAILECVRDVPALGKIRGLRSGAVSGGEVVLTAERLPIGGSPHRALPAPLRRLALEMRGLILVAGPEPHSGLRTLCAALVDVINRSRRAHIVTLEHVIAFVHERKASIVSQREVTPGAGGLRLAMRAALREHPDVLVLEGVNDSTWIPDALQDAGERRLVICSLRAKDSADALATIVGSHPAEERVAARHRLAQELRGVVTQVLVPRPRGSNVAAREVLVNTSAVARAIREGRFSELNRLMEGGSDQGMTSLNDALLALVQTRGVDPAAARARSTDPDALTVALRRRLRVLLPPR